MATMKTLATNPAGFLAEGAVHPLGLGGGEAHQHEEDQHHHFFQGDPSGHGISHSLSLFSSLFHRNPSPGPGPGEGFWVLSHVPTGNCPGHHTVISAPVPWRASG